MYRAVASYAVAAFVVMQVVNEFAPALRLPAWVQTVVALALLAGFPVAVGLAWAFDWTPQGVRRTDDGPGPDAGAGPGVVPLGVTAALTLVLAGVGIGVALDALRPGVLSTAPEGGLDPDGVAVLPFRTSGAPGLDYLSEGMVDLLAAKFTGEGGLEAVEPRTVLTLLPRDSSREGLGVDAALSVARSAGAGQAVLGSVVATGGNRITLSARLLDAAEGGVAARSEVEGVADSLPALVDRLAAELLSLRAGEASESLGSLTTTSLPALRAYLEARADFREGRFAEAQDAAGEALDEDSTFVLAALTQIEAAGFTNGSFGRGRRVARRGASSLARRDRIYLESLIGPREAAGVSWAFHRDRLPFLERAVEAMPERPSAWYHLGDVYYHWGPGMGIEDFRDRALEYLGRALELDSLFVPAGTHVSDLLLARRDTAAAVELMERMRRADPEADFSTALAWLAAALRGTPEERAEARRELVEDGPGTALAMPLILSLDFELPVEDADEVARVYARRTVAPGQAAFRDAALFAWHLSRGRPEAAETHRRELARSASPELAASLALWAVLHWGGVEAPVRDAVALLEGRQSERSAASPGSGLTGACALGYWQVLRGDRGRGLALADLLATRAEAASDGGDVQAARDRLCSLLIRARAAAGPERRALLERADSLSLRGIAFPFLDPMDRIQARVLAELFREEGMPERALGATRRVVNGLPASAPLADLLGLRAELAEELGRDEEASRIGALYRNLRPRGAAPEPATPEDGPAG